MGLAKLKPLKDPLEFPVLPLQDHPRFKAAAAERDKLKELLAKAQHRERVALARRSGQKSSRPNEDRAAALLAGGRVSATNPNDELAAAHEEQLIIQEAILAQNEAIEALIGELSSEMCRRLRPISDDAHRAALAAATDLFAALEVARTCRARLIGAGYRVNTFAMPFHVFEVAAALGDPSRSDSPSGLFRQWLEQQRGSVP